jgi:hypothetical protein
MIYSDVIEMKQSSKNMKTHEAWWCGNQLRNFPTIGFHEAMKKGGGDRGRHMAVRHGVIPVCLSPLPTSLFSCSHSASRLPIAAVD